MERFEPGELGDTEVPEGCVGVAMTKEIAQAGDDLQRSRLAAATRAQVITVLSNYFRNDWVWVSVAVAECDADGAGLQREEVERDEGNVSIHGARRGVVRDACGLPLSMDGE